MKPMHSSRRETPAEPPEPARGKERTVLALAIVERDRAVRVSAAANAAVERARGIAAESIAALRRAKSHTIAIRERGLYDRIEMLVSIAREAALAQEAGSAQLALETLIEAADRPERERKTAIVAAARAAERVNDNEAAGLIVLYLERASGYVIPNGRWCKEVISEAL